MQVVHEFDVSPEHLFDTLIDPPYLAARQEKFGGIGDPSVAEEDDQIVVTTKRQLPLDKVPGAFRGFVGDGQIVQVDQWDASTVKDPETATTGTWSASVGTAPAQIGGTHEIVGTDEGSRYAIGIEVSIKIPFVGGKFEKQVSGYLEYLISKELDHLDQWIGSQ